jgi:ribosome-binding protein aMBF1 (putative translation factor)
LEWSREDPASKAGISDRTITDFERGARDPHDNNKRAIQSAFEAAGVVSSETTGAYACRETLRAAKGVRS